MGLFDKAKEKLQKSLGEMTAPEAEPTEDLLSKQLRSRAVVGGEYPCKKDKKVSRVTAGKGIRIGSKVTIERFTYQRKPAYMVVNPKNGLDIGVLSQGTAFAVADRTKAKVIQGEIVDSFIDASGLKNWKVYFELDD